jgi:serine protease Do
MTWHPCDSAAAKRPHRQRGRIAAAALGSAAALALIVGAAGITPALSDNPAPANAAVRGLETDRGYAELVAAVSPAVVNVSVVRAEEESAGPGGTPFADPEMRRFFERFFGQMPEMQPMPERRRMQGQGSGFIVDPSGTIVTNAHVVGRADKVEVTLHDGSKYEATIKGVDERSDLAVIQVDAGRPLPYVELGDSTKVRVGDKVLAIGNPFGLGGTVTAGIVSATNREIGSGPYDDFLQIDAPINRGNSGGPTFNLDGEVVGVNTAIFSPSGGSIGIGFAISSNLAKEIVADLVADGRVARGWLGVSIQGLDDDIAASLGLEKATGALVARVEPDSPAAAAGLQSRDVIVDFAGQPIDSVRDLTRAVARTPSGTKAEVTVWRDGKRETLAAEVGQQPDARQVAAAEEPEAADQPRLGLALAPLPPEMRERLGLADQIGGVLVQRVVPDSPAESKGMRPGDVILEVAGKSVATPTEVIEAVRAAHNEGAKAVLLLVQRDGRPVFEAIPFAVS